MKRLRSLWIFLFVMALACQTITGKVTQPTQVLVPTLTMPSTQMPAATHISPPTKMIASTSAPSTTPGEETTTLNKWSLWVDGPHLRGANIYQRRIYPELDGPTYMGPGPLGPPFTQEDFNQLAELGANYVNISHPGLFSEKPPFTLDENVQQNLDRLLEMIAKADMFAVISFRTGPGRSEFTFYWGTHGDWFTEDYYNDTVWEDEATQEAWVAMWRYTAERYKDNPVVVGYDLMVEPNSNEVWFNEWDPETFYAQHGSSSYDWNQLAQRISDGIRQVDAQTPILIGGNAYSAINWLPYLKVTGGAHTVYLVHQYSPVQYTAQEPGEEGYTYPGEFDIEGNGSPEVFNRVWLEKALFPVIEGFTSEHAVPVAANEYGVKRWAPGASGYLRDLMDLFETHHMNSALWEWNTSWPERAANYDDYNFLHGSDPDNHEDVDNTLLEVIRLFWARNQYRPSNTRFGG